MPLTVNVSNVTSTMNVEPANSPENTSAASPANFVRPRVRTGGDLDRDERVQAMYQREMFFLSVLIPRTVTWQNGMRAIMVYVGDRTTLLFLALCMTVFASITAVCATSASDSELCSGGPLDGVGKKIFIDFHGYWPGILNSLGVLLLSFYGSTCLGRYIGAYDACCDLKASCIDLCTIAVGSIKLDSKYAAISQEIWRATNLLHLCTYVLADKHRTTYSFDNFVVPVAEHYGYYDGKVCFFHLLLSPSLRFHLLHSFDLLLSPSLSASL